jgi:hypothetical protein
MRGFQRLDEKLEYCPVCLLVTYEPAILSSVIPRRSRSSGGERDLARIGRTAARLG